MIHSNRWDGGAGDRVRRLREHVQTLATQPRNRSLPGSLEAARAYVTENLTGSGWQVDAMPFRTWRGLALDRNEGSVRDVFWPPSYAGVLEGVNLVATATGRAFEAGDLLLIAHLDSVATSPGADDNASGVAIMLEVAAALGTEERPGVGIALVDLEEMATLGSQQLARTLPRPGAVLCLESLGFFSDEPGSQSLPGALARAYPHTAAAVRRRDFRGDFILSVHRGRSLQLHRELSRHLDEAGVPVVGLLDHRWEGCGQAGRGNGLARLLSPTAMHLDRSDHAPFWRRGVPAVMLTGTATLRNHEYHRTGDTAERLDYERMARICAAVTRLAQRSDGSHGNDPEQPVGHPSVT